MPGTRPDVFYENQPVNLTPGEPPPVPAKFVDIDKILDNLRSIFRAVSRPGTKGTYCIEGNANGASAVGQCNIIVRNDQGNLGVIDTGDFVIISDGTRTWGKYTTDAPATGDDEISFTDAHIMNNQAGPADYSTAGFRNSLTIEVVRMPQPVDAITIDRDNTHANALMGSNIARSAADATNLNAHLTALYNKTQKLDAAGDLNAGVLKPSQLGVLFAEQGYENLVDGDFEFYPTGGVFTTNYIQLADGWLPLPGGGITSAGQTTLVANKKRGAFSQRMDTTANGAGAYFAVADFTRFAGKKVSISCWVKADTDDGISVGFTDDVVLGIPQSFDESPAAGTSGAWHLHTHTGTVGGAPNALWFVVRAKKAIAIIWYADCYISGEGIVPLGYVPSPDEVKRDLLFNSSQVSFIPNGDYRDWSNGFVSPFYPNRWDAGIGVPISTARGSAFTKYGSSWWELRLDGGDGVKTSIFVDTGRIIRAGDMNLGIWLKPHAATPGTNPIQLRAEFSAGADVTSDPIPHFNFPSGEWTFVYLKIPENLAGGDLVRLNIENVTIDASDAWFMVDTPSLVMGKFPCGVMPSSAYQKLSIFFTEYGTIGADGYLFLGNTNVGVMAVMAEGGIPYHFQVMAGAVGGIGVVAPQIQLWENGAVVPAYNLDVVAANTLYSSHVPDETEHTGNGLKQWAYLDWTDKTIDDPVVRLDYLILTI